MIARPATAAWTSSHAPPRKPTTYHVLQTMHARVGSATRIQSSVPIAKMMIIATLTIIVCQTNAFFQPVKVVQLAGTTSSVHQALVLTQSVLIINQMDHCAPATKFVGQANANGTSVYHLRTPTLLQFPTSTQSTQVPLPSLFRSSTPITQSFLENLR